MGLSLVSMVFICVSLAGFSLNQGVVQNTYWAGANLPDFEVNDDYKVDGLNVILDYGLRLVVGLCDGKRCSGDGDDIYDGIKSTRLQNCYDYGQDTQQDTCLMCRDAGLAAGALVILDLVSVLVLMGLVGFRFFQDNDNAMIKYASIAMSGVVMLFAFLAITVYGGQCYTRLTTKQFADDDHIDQDNIDWYVGPGFVVLLVAMIFQPGTMLCLFITPCGDEGQARGGDTAGANNGGGAATGGGNSGSMAGKEESNQA